jgi:hypothetical protein
MRLAGMMQYVASQISEEKILVGLQLFLAFILLMAADKIAHLFYPSPQAE